MDVFQEPVANLEHAHGDLEQYGRRLCVSLENIPVATDETADKILDKVENVLKEACPSLSGNVVDRAIVSEAITNVSKPIIPCSIGTGIN